MPLELMADDLLDRKVEVWYQSLSEKEKIQQIIVWHGKDNPNIESAFPNLGAILYKENQELNVPSFVLKKDAPLRMFRTGILFQQYQEKQNLAVLQQIQNHNLLFQLGRQKGQFYASRGVSYLFVEQPKVHPSILTNLKTQQQHFFSGLRSSNISFDIREPNFLSNSWYSENNLVKDVLNEIDLVDKPLVFFKTMRSASEDIQKLRLQALQKGADMIWVNSNLQDIIQFLQQALLEGHWSKNRLEVSVKKVLRRKLEFFSNRTPTAIHPNKVFSIQQRITENAIQLNKNASDVIPIKNMENKRVAYIGFGNESGETFYNYLKKYTRVKKVSAYTGDDLEAHLKDRNMVIIGLHRRFPSYDGSYFTEAEKSWLYQISQKRQVLLVLFTQEDVLQELEHLHLMDAIVVSHINHKMAQKCAAEYLFNAVLENPLEFSDKSIGDNGFFVQNNRSTRLGYAYPENVGLDSNTLLKIDSLMQVAIDSMAIPGGQVLVARKGKVILEKSYGFHTYNKEYPVRNENLYDLASVTKILATLPLIMQLQEWRQINLESNFGNLLPELRDKEIGKVKLLDALAHYGRMPAWIPFYFKTLDSLGKPSSKYYRRNKTTKFNIRVHENLYMRKDFRDSMYLRIDTTKLKKRLRYRYSDLTYYILKRVAERNYGKSIDKVLEKELYEPLGANNTLFNPRRKFNKTFIVPSEKDTYFRHSTLQGYVHDMGAAMLGGVGGHAGLFSNANDVAKIMQLFLQKGKYGGKEYFQSSTIDLFNTCYFCEQQVRRGLGFDKPQLKDSGPTCGCVSASSFGHSGFTGTFVWADPEKEIVYVFLSNRTYPTANNRKLIELDTRAKIQEVIYKAIIN